MPSFLYPNLYIHIKILDKINNLCINRIKQIHMSLRKAGKPFFREGGEFHPSVQDASQKLELSPEKKAAVKNHYDQLPRAIQDNMNALLSLLSGDVFPAQDRAMLHERLHTLAKLIHNIEQAQKNDYTAEAIPVTEGLLDTLSLAITMIDEHMSSGTLSTLTTNSTPQTKQHVYAYLQVLNGLSRLARLPHIFRRLEYSAEQLVTVLHESKAHVPRFLETHEGIEQFYAQQLDEKDILGVDGKRYHPKRKEAIQDFYGAETMEALITTSLEATTTSLEKFPFASASLYLNKSLLIVGLALGPRANRWKTLLDLTRIPHLPPKQRRIAKRIRENNSGEANWKHPQWPYPQTGHADSARYAVFDVHGESHVSEANQAERFRQGTLLHIPREHIPAYWVMADMLKSKQAA